jgi:hypothetical protein
MKTGRSPQDLFEEFDLLVREYRDYQGATTDAGEEVFVAIERAMSKNGNGTNWAFLEGFLRRCQ